ncbi:MAG: endonuclease III [Prevotella sp.]|nr:endonuclease III [Prevotella sp.]
MTLNERYTHILSYFRESQPTVTTELEFGSIFQLLVAVVLSAQCTDKRVNQVTPALFRRYPSAKEMSQAEPEDLLELMGSVSYPNSKAAHLCALSRQLMAENNGEVPSTMDELTRLPGVGRKTANVILSVAFDQPTIAVDTHVYRVSHRLGLVASTANTPLKVEQTLLRHIPASDLSRAHHWLLLHGRYICTSQKPKCQQCPLTAWCRHFGKQAK